MMENKLPKNWQIKKLGEVVSVLDNLRKPINSTERLQRINGKNEKDLFPYYGATGQVGWIDSFLTNGDFILVGEDGAPFLDNFKNKAYKISGKTWVNNHAHILQEKENITLNNFILYYLNSIDYRQYVNGTTRLKLTKGSLTEIPFPIPPIKMQQDIVSKIEELFSELDKGIEDLKTAQQQLKTYRQSVLNLLATNKNLMPIEKIIDRLDQGWSPKCENQASVDKNQWAVIKTSAIQQGYFVEIENKILPINLIPKEQHEIEVGDILITRAGPRVRVGVCCMVKHTRPKLINCDKVYRIKVNKKLILPEYFEYILNTPKYQDEIEKMKSGISDSGLNLTQKVFVQITIPVPPIEEQHQIVQEIESRLSVADKMEESIAQSLQQAEALRQSILKKAFAGELVEL